VHDVKYGFGFRRVNATTRSSGPANGICSSVTPNPHDLFAAGISRGSGTNRTTYMDFYVGDTISKSRATIEHRHPVRPPGRHARPSVTAANPAFPGLVPGLNFAGYDAPFTWNNVSPRAGVTYALDEARTMLVACQLQPVFRSAGLRQRRIREPELVGRSRGLSLARSEHRSFRAGGRSAAESARRHRRWLQPANPTAVTSANQIDPNLKAPVTQSIVAGLERELRSNLSVQVNYTYTKTTNLLGNATFSVTPRVGVSRPTTRRGRR